MSFKESREKKIEEAAVESHAECLAAMDCLMHHLNDEDEIAYWLRDGVPDNSHWNILNAKPRNPPDNRTGFYTELVKNMTYGDFEACVMMFALAVKAQCFTMKYTPRAFT